METASEAVEPRERGPAEVPGLSELELTAPAGATVADRSVSRPTARRRTRRLSATARRELLWITVVFIAARGMLLLVAFLNGKFGAHNFLGELAHWDGLWYRELANKGYPHQISYGQTTLGFFPLYPITIWLLEPVFLVLTVHNQIWASTVAGVLISGAGGLVTTILVHRLADGWWGRDVARRAVVLFVVFPGSVVFSMVYSEGLLLPLAAACIYALERRRWVLAGVVAGLGTAVQPVGLALPFVCLSVVALELWRHGWRAPSFRRSLIAPVLSVTGAVAFAVFLWAWTGNPFANYIAQHHGWGEKTDPLALVHTFTRLIPSFDPSHFNHPPVNLNLVVGLIGAVIMIAQLVLMWRARRELSVPAIAWTLAITFLAFTSEYVPPNPRLMITAFPGLLLFARYTHGKRFAAIVAFNVVLLAGLSGLTFTAHILRP